MVKKCCDTCGKTDSNKCPECWICSDVKCTRFDMHNIPENQRDVSIDCEISIKNRKKCKLTYFDFWEEGKSKTNLLYRIRELEERFDMLSDKLYE